MKIQSERPIKDKSEDMLKRSRFAINVARKINNYNHNESITIGLMGPWGSGKSSTINMIKSEIDESNITIVDFNPWYFAGRKQLISDFFQLLSNVIGTDGDNVKKLSEDLKLYSAALKPLTIIPQIGSIVNIISKLTESGGNFLNEYHKSQNDDISKIKERINNQIREYDKKILVIIDEIDRLENDDIKEIFQLVRALGDFDNMIYLLSFDKEKVCNVFTSGKDYLDKIINVPIYVPEISMKNVNDYFINELGKVFDNKVEIDSEYWKEIYRCVFENKFQNLREVNRFLNVVRFNCDDIIKDLNVVDYLVINFLKMFDVQYYRFIKENRNILVNGNSSKDSLGNLLKDLNPQTTKNIDFKGLINLLFYRYTIPQKRGIRRKNYFDSYFEYSLRDDVFSFTKIDKYCNLIKKEDLDITLKNMEKAEIVNLFNNLDNISEKLSKEQIYFYEEVLVGKILLLDKTQSNTFTQESEQCIAFLSLKNMIIKLDKYDENIVSLVDKFEFSEGYELQPLLKYILELKEYFIVDRFEEKLVKKLDEYIYSLKYSDEIKRNFNLLKKLEFNLEKYIKSILDNEEGIIAYLQSLIEVVNVHYNEIRDSDGEVISVEEYYEEEIVLESISDYIDYDYIKEKVDALSEISTKANNDLIRKFYYPMSREEVNQRYDEQQQLEEENYYN